MNQTKAHLSAHLVLNARGRKTTLNAQRFMMKVRLYQTTNAAIYQFEIRIFWKISEYKEFLQLKSSRTISDSLRFHSDFMLIFSNLRGFCVGKIKAAYLRVWIYIEDSICFREIFFFLQHQIVSSILCLFFCLLHIIVDLVFVKIIHTVLYCV